MRAERLLSLLMLLQARGRMTAQRLAEELEVSERTVYRDIDSLSAAGIPVYCERGPGGGYALLDHYRTTLTGLTEAEARALFMLSIPQPLNDLGVSQELKMALLKLVAALPAARRLEQERARQRIHLDSTAWFQTEELAPHLPTVHRAVWEDRRLRIVYRLPFDTLDERIVDPYGLVAKANIWYLICGGESPIRAQRVSKIVEAEILAETFERPADFDLAVFWESWRSSRENNRPDFPVTVRVSPELAPFLSPRFYQQVQGVTTPSQPDAKGWITLTLHFDEFYAARMCILGWGKAVEVLEPYALRCSVLDFAEQIVAFYRQMENRLSAHQRPEN